MSTSAASFSSWEERWAKYIAYGGSTGYSSGLPGQVTNPNTESYRAWISLTKTDPRASVVYPNAWIADAYADRAAQEATALEWSNYSRQWLRRYSGASGQLEAVDLGSGQWVVRSRAAQTVTFTAPLGGDSGTQLNYVVLSLPGPSVAGIAPLYALLVAQLDTPLDAVAAGTNLTIPAQDLYWEMR